MDKDLKLQKKEVAVAFNRIKDAEKRLDHLETREVAEEEWRSTLDKALKKEVNRNHHLSTSLDALATGLENVATNTDTLTGRLEALEAKQAKRLIRLADLEDKQPEDLYWCLRNHKEINAWQSHILPRVNGHAESLKAAHGKLAAVTARQESLGDLVLVTREELGETRTLLRAAMEAFDQGMMVILGKGEILTIEGVGRVVRLPVYNQGVPLSEDSPYGHPMPGEDGA